MTGLIKMHLLKMLRQKGFYITILLFLLVTFGAKKTMGLLGNDDFTFADTFALSAGFYPMFVALFPVFLFNKDISSGFIKNYGGSLPRREDIAIERIIFTVIENAIFFTVASLGVLAISGFNIELNLHMFGFLGILYIAGVAMTLLCLLFVEVTRNNALSIVATILVGIGLVNTILSTLISLVFKSVNISDFTLSGLLGGFNSSYNTQIALKLLAVSACYILIAAIGNIISTHKRDVLIA